MTWVFWIAAAVTAYAYVGYLGSLWMRAQFRPHPVKRAPVEPSVSLVMVVRNEESVLPAKLRNLLEIDYPAARFQIVIVSDGSTDGTEAILREQAKDSRVQVMLNQLARGKAQGLNDGLSLASGEIVVFTDARQQIERGAIRLLVENFADSEVGCVSGALMLGDPELGESGKSVGLYWSIEKKVRELESATGSVVGATGALYAVRRELIPTLPEGTILDDVYIPMEVVRQGKRVVFDNRACAWDRENSESEAEFARKVRTLSGNYQLLQLAPWILSGQNPLRGRFLGHKLLRLAVPFTLAAMLVASFLLKPPFYKLALALQLALYGLGFLALARMPKPRWLARVADAAGVFMLLNTAAVVAFANFVAGRKIVWSR